MKKIACLFIGFCLFTNLSAQKVYRLDASDVMETTSCGHLKMGNPGPKEKAIEVNSLYMTMGGKPILPVMGELHFSRIRKDLWEDRILKMKACGINIISTYLFWNHHEEIEGQFERSFRYFFCKIQSGVPPLRASPCDQGPSLGTTNNPCFRHNLIKLRKSFSFSHSN